jgi:hypothetical protein
MFNDKKPLFRVGTPDALQPAPDNGTPQLNGPMKAQQNIPALALLAALSAASAMPAQAQTAGTGATTGTSSSASAVTSTSVSTVTSTVQGSNTLSPTTVGSGANSSTGNGNGATPATPALPGSSAGPAIPATPAIPGNAKVPDALETLLTQFASQRQTLLTLIQQLNAAKTDSDRQQVLSQIKANQTDVATLAKQLRQDIKTLRDQRKAGH